MSSFFRRRNDKEKVDDSTFLKNGGILLEQLITSGIGKRNPIRSFSAEELNLATNNYDEEKVIARDDYCRLYKGFLRRPFIVMKYADYLESTFFRDKLCFNNIVFASQVYHKNILKLIGCCLETEIPILVFESVEYCTLADWIYSPHQLHLEPLLLRQRLKIAMEIANAMAYLHSGLPRPIVFRDLKPFNILVDELHVAKLYDFSLSVSIPEGETHIKDDNVAGTYGFLAPEYISTLECNEKCDVYSFGSLLLVLLTGQEIYNLFSLEQENDHTEDSVDQDDCTKADYSERDYCTKVDYSEEDDCTKTDSVEADDCTQADSVEDDDDYITADYVEEDDSTISSYDAEYYCRGSNLLFYYLKEHIENNTFNEIVDPIIVGEASFPEMQQQLEDFIQLICECVNRSAEDRPTMIYVAKQLRNLYLSVVYFRY